MTKTHMIHLSYKSFIIKLIINLAIFCSISFYSIHAYSKNDLSDLVKKVAPSIVAINVFDKDGKLNSLGTGFFIKENGVVVTNYHVVEGGVRGEVKLSSGEVLKIDDILLEDKEGDLILLSIGIKGRTFQALKISDIQIKAGQPVVVIGNPFGLEGSVSDGIVSAVRDIPVLGKVLQITAPISKGSSGSPVLNMEGELVGIAISYIKEGQSLNFAVAAGRLVDLLSLQQKKARTFFKSAKETKFPEPSERFFIFGLLSMVDRRWEEAITYFEKKIEKQPNHPESHFFLGLCYRELSQYYSKEAIEDLKHAVTLKPNYVEAHNELGLIYLKLGQYDKALEILQSAIRTKPNYVESYRNLAQVYVNIGSPREAISLLKEAIRLEPDYVVGHYNLGLAYLLVGNKSLALEEYKILKGLDVEKASDLFNLIYK